MPPAEHPVERIYSHPPHYLLRYRRGRRLRWTHEAATDYAFLLVLDGRLIWRASSSSLDENAETTLKHDDSEGETSGNVSAPAAILAAPGDVLSARSDASVEMLSVTLSPVFVLDCAARARMMRADSFISFNRRAVDADERLARLARDLAHELVEDEAGQVVAVGALIEQALVHVLRRYAVVRRSDQLELSRAGLTDRRIRRAVELMHAHLERDLPLEEIASAAHLSPFHFSRLFKKLTGATPHSYLAALRISRAQRLLAETDLSVTEIGARVGYASSSHFSKAFRQATGLAPRAFRAALVGR